MAMSRVSRGGALKPATDRAAAGRLLRATAGAFVSALAILITMVLPAEYGLDPTGVGARIGLLRPAAARSPAVQGIPLPTGSKDPVTRDPAPFRTDELTLTLAFGEGAEIKASMRAGQRFLFTWTAEGGPVDVDMHGEPFNAAPNVFTSYWKAEDQTSGHGSFEAPFDGKHGWYWEHVNSAPVTIKVKVSGYYDAIARQ